MVGPFDRKLSSLLLLATAITCTWIYAQRSGVNNSFPGGTNPDGYLRPSPPLTRLFQQDAYTEYAILAPGTDQFRVMFMPEETRAGATELVNATRGGSEGSDIEVYDPRSGKPLPFTYQPLPDDPEGHAIHAKLPRPVPEGGVGRVLIYKTYKDPRTYLMNGDDIVWVRGLSAQRFGVILPNGFSFISSNIAAQVTTTADGRLKLALTNPSGGGSPITIHARKTGATFTPAPKFTDMFLDDVRTLYDLEAAGSHVIRVEQIYSESRKGEAARLDSLAYLPLQNLQVMDLDTARTLTTARAGGAVVAKLEAPITNAKQSAHIKITGILKDDTYRVDGGDLVFDRTLHGLRNTVLLPAGWEICGLSQSGTIGTFQGRAFVALININGENAYRVMIRARRSS